MGDCDYQDEDDVVEFSMSNEGKSQKGKLSERRDLMSEISIKNDGYSRPMDLNLKTITTG